MGQDETQYIQNLAPERDSPIPDGSSRCNEFTYLGSVSGTEQEPRVMRGQLHSNLGKRLLRETRGSPIRSYSTSGTF